MDESKELERRLSDMLTEGDMEESGDTNQRERQLIPPKYEVRIQTERDPGMFEMADMPYVGAGVLASAGGMDKVVMKKLFAQAGIDQCVESEFVEIRDQTCFFQVLGNHKGTW